MKEIKLGVILMTIVVVVTIGGVIFFLTGSKQPEDEKDSKKEKKEKKKDKDGEEKNTDESLSKCAFGELLSEKDWAMPAELKEISGIAYLGSDRVAAVQDSEGSVYVYDLSQSKVAQKIKFGGAGDYEGLVYLDKKFFVMRSDGFMQEVDMQGKVLNSYKLPLSEADNIESFTYDKAQNRLLIGQKDGPNKTAVRKIFAFELNSRKFNTTPVLEVNYEDLLSACGDSSEASKSGKKKKKSADVRPSEMSIDPKSGDILIADGPNHRIFVFTSDGKFKHFLPVDKKKFPQVEGMFFTPEGELFISTEGIKDPAMISKMAYN